MPSYNYFQTIYFISIQSLNPIISRLYNIMIENADLRAGLYQLEELGTRDDTKQ